MTAAAGKKRSTSLSLFLEAFGLQVEEELSTMATEGAWIGKWCTEHKEAWRKPIFEVQTWRHVRRPAGAVVRDTRDLDIKWPEWHTSSFEGQVAVDMRDSLPKRCEEDALETGEINLLEEVGSEARV